MFPVKQRHKIGTIGLQKKKQYLANKKKPVKYKNENRNIWHLPGFLAATSTREVFINLKDAPHLDQLLKSACKVIR